ncbi:MAG: hypothetical protein IIC49_03240 [Planctomycetes bacterium]|nr:hypothetical protein [Planctomycetota bacterium]
MTTHAPTQAVRTLMAGLIDYAGLFPPASLDMQPTVETFARDRMGEHEWILGRLICPATFWPSGVLDWDNRLDALATAR